MHMSRGLEVSSRCLLYDAKAWPAHLYVLTSVPVAIDITNYELIPMKASSSNFLNVRQDGSGTVFRGLTS